MSDKSTALPSLTGIRGVAAVWVVAFHMAEVTAHDTLPVLRDGYRAVDLFFILSGFIMMHVHQRDFKVMSRFESARFLCLRGVRVYPLSTVVLLLMVPFMVTHPSFVDYYRHQQIENIHAYSFAGFWQTLLLANRWFLPDLGTWNGPTWSLSVELLAYGTFPLLAFLLWRENSRVRCLVYGFGVLLVMVLYLLAIHKAEINAKGYNGILRGLAGFFAGMALYRFCWLSKSSFKAENYAALAGLLSCAVLLAALLVPHASVISLFCFMALIGSLFFQRGVVSAVLGSRFVVFLGSIRFSLYLVHLIPLRVLSWLLKTGNMEQNRGFVLASYVAYTVIVFAISVALHYWVERPAQRAGRLLIKRWFSRDQEPVPN